MSFQSFFFYLGKIASNLGLNACKPKDFQTAKCLVKAIADATECVGHQMEPQDFVSIQPSASETLEFIADAKMTFTVSSTFVGSVQEALPFETTYLEIAGQQFDLEEYGLIGRTWILCEGDKVILTNNGATSIAIQSYTAYF